MENVERKTVGQSDCEMWKELRKGRVSASRINEHFENLRKGGAMRVRSRFNSSSSAIYTGYVQQCMNWGKRMEKYAIQKYEQFTGLKVTPCGLHVLSEDERICASPDGKVLAEDGNCQLLIEVKCPFSKRTKTIKECVDSGRFYLKRRRSFHKQRENNSSLHPVWNKLGEIKYFLDRSHPQGARIYDQIQLQLHCVGGVRECHLVVFTKCSLAVVPILLDESFRDRLNRLMRIIPPLAEDRKVDVVSDISSSL